MPDPTRRTAAVLATLIATATLAAAAPAALALNSSDWEGNSEKIARFNVEMYVEKVAP